MRRKASSRTSTYEDLDSVGQRIHDAIPPELQQEFLRRQPRIKENAATREKVISALSSQLEITNSLIEALTPYRKSLERGIRDAKGSGNLSQLKGLLELPQTSGVAIRKTRTRRKKAGGGDGASAGE